MGMLYSVQPDAVHTGGTLLITCSNWDFLVHLPAGMRATSSYLNQITFCNILMWT